MFVLYSRYKKCVIFEHNFWDINRENTEKEKKLNFETAAYTRYKHEVRNLSKCTNLCHFMA